MNAELLSFAPREAPTPLPRRYAIPLVVALSVALWAFVAALVALLWLAASTIAQAQTPAKISASYQCVGVPWGYVLVDDQDGLAWLFNTASPPSAITGATVTLDNVTWPTGSFNRGTGVLSDITDGVSGVCQIMDGVPASGNPRLSG